MAIVNSEIIKNEPSGVGARVQFLYTAHNGDTITSGERYYEGDVNAYMLSLIPTYENALADRELREVMDTISNEQNGDRVAQHQPQADLDRKVLGLLMQIRDVHIFHAGLAYFQAVELRGGANANQRASYLGVPASEYNLVDNRFGDVQGVAFFITNEKSQVWTDRGSFK